MATRPSYIPLRDDASIKSISKNERDFLRQCALLQHDRSSSLSSLRMDGRTRVQSRPTRLVLTRYPNGAAAATLQWGTGTRVTVNCTGDIVPPVDRPNEAMVNISVELSPSASTSFRQVAPVSNMAGSSSVGGNRGAGTADEAQKLETNRILRALERLLASCLDTEALVVTPGQWVWRLGLSVVVLDAAAGNLMDACWMATLAALQHYRQPHTEARNKASENENQNSPLAPVMLSLDAKEGTPLPLHQVPFAVSFALITDETDSSKRKVVYLQDPSQHEEMIAAGKFTYALNVHQEVCLVDFGGGAEINPLLMREVHQAAAIQVGLLTKVLSDTLKQADEQAIQERLQSLKQNQPNIPATAIDPSDQQQETNDIIDLPPMPEGEIKSPDDLKAEEEYRRQALDYNLGHVAQPLADRDVKKKPTSKVASVLLANLLKTASQNQNNEPANNNLEESVTENPAAQPPANEESSKTKTKTTVSHKMQVGILDDDDEEEETVQLQSEFSAAAAPFPSQPVKAKAPSEPPRATKASVNDDDQDDVDDLAAAIKTKKKKKKKK